MGKLLIVEAIPGKLITLFHMIRAVTIVGCGMFLFVFLRKESELMGEYMQTKIYQDRMQEYDRIMEEAERLYAEGNLAESEQLCLQVLSDTLADPTPYLRLSDIYCDNKLYYEALEILETYPGEVQNREVSDKKQEIGRRIQDMEKSCFTVVN